MALTEQEDQFLLVAWRLSAPEHIGTGLVEVMNECRWDYQNVADVAEMLYQHGMIDTPDGGSVIFRAKGRQYIRQRIAQTDAQSGVQPINPGKRAGTGSTISTPMGPKSDPTPAKPPEETEDEDNVSPEEFNRPYQDFIRKLSAQPKGTVSTRQLETVFGMPEERVLAIVRPLENARLISSNSMAIYLTDEGKFLADQLNAGDKTNAPAPAKTTPTQGPPTQTVVQQGKVRQVPQGSIPPRPTASTRPPPPPTAKPLEPGEEIPIPDAFDIAHFDIMEMRYLLAAYQQNDGGEFNWRRLANVLGISLNETDVRAAQLQRLSLIRIISTAGQARFTDPGRAFILGLLNDGTAARCDYWAFEQLPYLFNAAYLAGPENIPFFHDNIPSPDNGMRAHLIQRRIFEATGPNNAKTKFSDLGLAQLREAYRRRSEVYFSIFDREQIAEIDKALERKGPKHPPDPKPVAKRREEPKPPPKGMVQADNGLSFYNPHEELRQELAELKKHHDKPLKVELVKPPEPHKPLYKRAWAWIVAALVTLGAVIGFFADLSKHLQDIHDFLKHSK